MAYMQILKVLHGTFLQSATRGSGQTCRLTLVSFIHTQRTVSAASRPTFLRRLEVPSSLVPALSCFKQTQPLRSVSLDLTARNKSNPEERDRSISRYQSGSPKPSAAQKGKQGTQLFSTGH